MCKGQNLEIWLGGTGKDTTDNVKGYSTALKETVGGSDMFETQIGAMNITLASRRQLREETGGRLPSWNNNKW